MAANLLRYLPLYITEDPADWDTTYMYLSDNKVIRYQTYQIPNLPDNELVRYRTYQLPNLSGTELIKYQTYQIPNISDNELTRYRTYQVQNLSDTKLIRNWTYQEPNLLDTKLVRYWTYQIPNLTDSKLIRYWIYQISNLSDTKLIRYPSYQIQTYQLLNSSDTEIIDNWICQILNFLLPPLGHTKLPQSVLARSALGRFGAHHELGGREGTGVDLFGPQLHHRCTRRFWQSSWGGKGRGRWAWHYCIAIFARSMLVGVELISGLQREGYTFRTHKAQPQTGQRFDIWQV